MALAVRAPTAWSRSTRPPPAAQGANIVRREYGLAESYVPCADPRLSQDMVPAVFEDAGDDGAAVRAGRSNHSLPSANYAPADGRQCG